MKVFVVTVLCALAGCAAGSAIAWPGAIAVSSPLVKTVIPGHTKTTAYSTTQYINAVPGSYPFAAQPQYAIQVPQVNSFHALHPGYFQVAGHSYIPAGNVYYPSAPAFTPVLGSAYPSAPIAPAFPSAPAYPSPAQPSPPSLQAPAAGDADSAVVDSAEFPPEQPRQPESEAMPSPPSQSPAPEPAQPSAPQFPPSNTFPNFPSYPQSPQQGEQPSFPQLPQLPQIPGFPQFPPNGFPQESQSPSNFPSAGNGAMGLSDEDTVSVEAA
ncbi:predicted GPI-anchored protein 58 [Trichoplusia ni]|uniref:Predicted GPI-anchored protein 58 n=1 Tax=Trichoplusia ni TaxID=7111 RepID=A0A7E5WGW2_TRINI|nr:predicted GPI-anchored protein 58 [Trichoplusia ni]